MLSDDRGEYVSPNHNISRQEDTLSGDACSQSSSTHSLSLSPDEFATKLLPLDYYSSLSFFEDESAISQGISNQWETGITTIIRSLLLQSNNNNDDQQNENIDDLKENQEYPRRIMLKSDVKHINNFKVAKTVSAKAFVRRVLRHKIMQPESFIHATILVERLRKKNKITITKENIDKLFVVAAIISCKCLDDNLFDNSTYSLCLNCPAMVLNELELSFLVLINFEVFVTSS